MEGNLMDKLNQNGRRLSKSHRKIAQFMIEHYDKAAFMTASKMAKKLDISESTVVRFAMAMGYPGYPELQKDLQDLIRNRLTSVQRIEMSSELDQSQVLRSVLRADMQNIRQVMEMLDEARFARAVDAMQRGKRVFVLGMRSCAPLAQFLGYYLNFVLKQVHVITSGVSDVMEQVSWIEPDDVLVAISFPRYSKRTMDAVAYARERGATVLSITDGPLSPLAELSDITLQVKSDMASFVDSLVAPLSVINALIVALGMENRDRLSEHFHKMEEIWSDYHVYVKKEQW